MMMIVCHTAKYKMVITIGTFFTVLITEHIYTCHMRNQFTRLLQKKI